MTNEQPTKTPVTIDHSLSKGGSPPSCGESVTKEVAKYLEKEALRLGEEWTKILSHPPVVKCFERAFFAQRLKTEGYLEGAALNHARHVYECERVYEGLPSEWKETVAKRFGDQARERFVGILAYGGWAIYDLKAATEVDERFLEGFDMPFPTRSWFTIACKQDPSFGIDPYWRAIFFEHLAPRWEQLMLERQKIEDLHSAGYDVGYTNLEGRIGLFYDYLAEHWDELRVVVDDKFGYQSPKEKEDRTIYPCSVLARNRFASFFAHLEYREEIPPKHLS